MWNNSAPKTLNSAQEIVVIHMKENPVEIASDLAVFSSRNSVSWAIPPPVSYLKFLLFHSYGIFRYDSKMVSKNPELSQSIYSATSEEESCLSQKKFQQG